MDFTIDELLNMEIPEIKPTIKVGEDEILVPDVLNSYKENQPELFQEVVTELNAQHLLTGAYESLAVLKRNVPELSDLGPAELQEFMEEVNESLVSARGCPPFKIKIKVQSTYDPRFIAACNSIADISDKRPVNAKLKSLKIKTNEWQAWQREPKNQEYLGKLLDRLMDKPLWEESRLALTKLVASGDLSAIKYAHELTDKFTPKSELNMQFITYLLSQIMEIIIRHTEPETAKVIADAIERVAIETSIQEKES